MGRRQRRTVSNARAPQDATASRTPPARTHPSLTGVTLVPLRPPTPVTRSAGSSPPARRRLSMLSMRSKIASDTDHDFTLRDVK